MIAALSRVGRVPPSYIVFVLLLAFLWWERPQMMNPNVLGIFLRQVAPLGIIVLAQLLVIRVGSIDLSGGGIILIINYIISAGILPNAPGGAFVAIALGLGIAVGTFNGYMIARQRVSAVIVTLAVSIILVGFVEYLSSGKPPGDVPNYMNALFDIRFGPMPAPVLFWVLLSAMLAALLSLTVFGRRIDAIGDNPIAAHFAGVPVERTVILTHMLAGLLTGIAALVQTASIAVGSVREGLSLPILSVAATILGGVVFGRGQGGVRGRSSAWSSSRSSSYA